jgi:hypothetical protein
MPQIEQNVLRPDTAERREITDDAIRQVSREEMVNFVTGVVLKVKQILLVTGPGIPVDWSTIFVRHHPCLSAFDRIDPDIDNPIRVRRQPGDLLAIGRERGGRPFRVCEKDLARNQWRQFRPGGEGASRHRQPEKEEFLSIHFCFF